MGDIRQKVTWNPFAKNTKLDVDFPAAKRPNFDCKNSFVKAWYPLNKRHDMRCHTFHWKLYSCDMKWNYSHEYTTLVVI